MSQEAASTEAPALPPSKPKLFPNPLKSGNLRNSPCPCDSGKKFKLCCWDTQESMVDAEKYIQARLYLEMLESEA